MKSRLEDTRFHVIRFLIKKTLKSKCDGDFQREKNTYANIGDGSSDNHIFKI